MADAVRHSRASVYFMLNRVCSKLINRASSRIPAPRYFNVCLFCCWRKSWQVRRFIGYFVTWSAGENLPPFSCSHLYAAGYTWWLNYLNSRNWCSIILITDQKNDQHSFTGFLFQHYFIEDGTDKDATEDSRLPFKSGDQLLTSGFVSVDPPQPVTVIPVITTGSEKNIPFTRMTGCRPIPGYGMAASRISWRSICILFLNNSIFSNEYNTSSFAAQSFPIIGTLIGSTLLLWGILRREQQLKSAGAFILVAMAAISFPVYLTGEPAENRGRPSVFLEKMISCMNMPPHWPPGCWQLRACFL